MGRWILKIDIMITVLFHAPGPWRLGLPRPLGHLL